MDENGPESFVRGEERDDWEPEMTSDLLQDQRNLKENNRNQEWRKMMVEGKEGRWRA